jgi:3-oxoacyl-ACP reductase-like protein
LQPPGLQEGEYYVEFYNDAGHIVPEPPGEPVIVSFWRDKPAAAAPAPASGPASPAVAAPAPAAPAPAPAPQDDWSANPDKWAHKLQVRQDHQMRDLGVAVFQQGIEQLKEIRDLYATMGQEQYKHQRLALDYGKEVFDLPFLST